MAELRLSDVAKIPRAPAVDWTAVGEQTWAALLVLDSNCYITQANEAACRLAGQEQASLIGRRFCTAFRAHPCEQLGESSCIFRHARQGNERRALPRWTTLEVNGTRTTVLLGADALRVRASRRRPIPTGVIVTMLTSEVLDAADSKRREIIAAAVHELRHLITIQTIAAELLSGPDLADRSAEAMSMVQRLQRATADLAAGVEDLQNRVLFDLGVVPLHPTAIDLTELLARRIAEHAPTLARRSQTARLVAPAGLEAWADSAAVEQVITNLLLNAHKYSVVGDEIIIRARRCAQPELVEVTVRDHGPGIPVHERRRIFERFYRGNTAQRLRGAGLGLAIVESLVSRQGGSVGVRGGRNGGAVFWFRLPAGPPSRWKYE